MLSQKPIKAKTYAGISAPWASLFDGRGIGEGLLLRDVAILRFCFLVDASAVAAPARCSFHPLVHLCAAFLNVGQRDNVVPLEARARLVSADLHRALFRHTDFLHADNSNMCSSLSVITARGLQLTAISRPVPVSESFPSRPVCPLACRRCKCFLPESEPKLRSEKNC